MYFLFFVPTAYLNIFFYLCKIPIRRFHILLTKGFLRHYKYSEVGENVFNNSHQ